MYTQLINLPLVVVVVARVVTCSRFDVTSGTLYDGTDSLVTDEIGVNDVDGEDGSGLETRSSILISGNGGDKSGT